MDIEDGATLGLQQGLIEQAFLRDMEAHYQHVTRPWRFRAFSVSEGQKYPVEVELENVDNKGCRTDGSKTVKVKARYLGK